MSITLLEFAKAYVNDAISVGNFVDSYQILWKIERDCQVSVKDDAELSERLSTIFCLADLYSSNSQKEAYELDAAQLKERVSSTISKSIE